MSATLLKRRRGVAAKRAVGRARRHFRVRKNISGTAERPRLVVTRSLRHITAQVVDDTRGHTLASASTLDASLRVSTGRAVSHALRTTGTTAVLVTHDQDEALSLADQVAVMRQGRLVQADRPRDLYRTPADADVARFVGGAAILPATVAAGIARCALGDAPVHGSVPDGEVEVVVRPEQVTIRPGHSARVGDVSFYGHDAAVRLELLPDGPSLVARVPGLSAPDPGTEVGVGLAGPLFVLGD